MPTLTKSNKAVFVAAAIILLLMAFVQCYKTTHDLHFAFDVDFDRDIGFARGTMNGHYGQDPNYKGEYLWYNPMLFTIEAAISKWTSIPINIVVVRAGTYLNLLGPICFFLMAAYFFGLEIALASMLSFLFVRAPMVNNGESFSYSPWLYPFCFAQFLFYINLALCYKAFLSQKYSWFVLLGLGIGLSFLAHAAPAILIVLIMVSMQGQNFYAAFKQKSKALIKKYFIQGLITFACFILAAMPLLYYIVVKYHFHTINRSPMEYTEGMFYLSKFMSLIKANLTLSFPVAVVGFFWFYKNFKTPIIRGLIFNWLFISILMYLYATLVAYLGTGRYGIHLPGTVPSFHYYFYIKTIQWVFFGFGFVFLVRFVFNKSLAFLRQEENQSGVRYWPIVLPVAVVALAIGFYPFYKSRPDFGYLRELSIIKGNDSNRIAAYNYILENIPEDKVILCEPQDTISLFPVMATARKMVSIAGTFSNPYLDFTKRENDRNDMLSFLKNGSPVSAKKLFSEYDVDYLLLSAKRLDEYKTLKPLTKELLFKNNQFLIYSIAR